MDKKEIEDFLQGRISEQGEKIFNKWYDSFPEPQDRTEVDAKTLQKEINYIKRGKSAPNVIRLFAWKKVAAVIIPLVATLAIIYLYKSVLKDAIDPVELSQHQVPAGTHTKVILADGSIVWLNAGSNLRYPKDFKQKTREVYLSGEAFFDIARDEKKPFIVYTKNLAVKVVGTSFNIQAYPGLEKEEVTVVTGKVNVTGISPSNKMRSVDLTPGQRATYLSLKDSLSMQKNLVPALTGKWREHKLVFDGMYVQDIVSTLQQHYNASIVLSDSSLAKQRVSAAFMEVLPLEKVLDLLSITLNTCYVKEGQNHVLGGTACRSQKKND